MPLILISPSFKHKSVIPERFTCDGLNISPALSWNGIPFGTQTLALIMDDPDVPKSLLPSGVWDHWILFNIPANTSQIDEAGENLPKGTKSGKNSWGKTGYGGPCPPDREHRYFFKLYALDSALDLPNGVQKQEVEKAMEGHIIEKTELIGLYNRPENR